MDISNTNTLERSNTKGRKSPLAWRNDKAKNRKEIQIVGDHEEKIPATPVPAPAPMPMMAPNSTGTGMNEDGTWYHFREYLPFELRGLAPF